MTDPPIPPLTVRLRDQAHIARLRELANWSEGDPYSGRPDDAVSLRAGADALEKLEAAHAETTRLRQERENIVVAVLRSLPDDMPAPSVVMEQDGEIGLDWNEASDVVLSLSLNDAQRTVGWSGLVRDHSGYGRFPLGSPTQDYLDMLTRYKVAAHEECSCQVSLSQRAEAAEARVLALEQQIRSFEDRTVAYILSITPEDMKLEIESNLRMQMQSWASPGAPRTAKPEERW